MAPRKNTQGAEDSLKGASPEEAEAQSAAGAKVGQQQPGGGDEGDTGSPAGDPVADLVRAVAAVSPDAARVIPEGADVQILRRVGTAASTIIHDDVHFAPGDPVPLTHAEFLQLEPTGALAERDWDRLTPL